VVQEVSNTPQLIHLPLLKVNLIELVSLFSISINLLFSILQNKVIAKYNISKSNTSYSHFDYSANLSDVTLPLTDSSIEQLKTIETINHVKFPI